MCPLPEPRLELGSLAVHPWEASILPLNHSGYLTTWTLCHRNHWVCVISFHSGRVCSSKRKEQYLSEEIRIWKEPLMLMKVQYWKLRERIVMMEERAMGS